LTSLVAPTFLGVFHGMRQAHPPFEQPHSDKIEMIRPSSDLVPVPLVPAGYRLRTLEAGEEPRYEALFRSAFDETGRLGEIPGKILPGAFFVVEHLTSHRLAASCLAFRCDRPPRHLAAGQLAWLVVDPAHGRKGLGTIVAATVTNRLASEGYARPFLRTDDARIQAISIYLNLGWQPSLYTAEMTGRWERIFAALDRNPPKRADIPALRDR
jgi:GNAT superfamily N-acetyltransferase